MDILPEYHQVVFLAELPENGWPREFFIITACNPNSGGNRDADKSRHEELRNLLSKLGCWLHEVEGASRDLQHREIGFAAAGLDLEQAIEAGRLFEQNAVFLIEDDSVWVIGCYTGLRQSVGSFSQRLNPSH